MKVPAFEADDRFVAPFFISLASCLVLFGLATLLSWGKPLICCDYGCTSILQYITGVMVGLSIISGAAAIFCLPFIVNLNLLSLVMWILPLYIISFCHVALHPMNISKNPNGKLAFDYVVKNDILALSKLLISSPEIIRELSYKNNTLLHQAVVYKRMGIIALLISNDIPEYQENAIGETPYDTALRIKSNDIANYLSPYRRIPHYELYLEIKDKDNKSGEIGYYIT